MKIKESKSQQNSNGPHTNEKPYKCSQYEQTLLSIYPMYKTWRHEKILNIKGVNAANVIIVYLRKWSYNIH